MASLRIPLIALTVVFPLVFAAAASPDPQAIAEYIRKLGHERYAERQAAWKALEEIGRPALDALKQAAGRDEDPEIQRRARELVHLIERRLEREEVLRPTLIGLDLAEIAVPDALAQLSKQSGYRIEFVGDRAELAKRKVTLKTGEVPFWEAFDQLCLKADLTHVSPDQAKGVVGMPAAAPGGLPGARGIGAQDTPWPLPPHTLVVIAGRPPRYPTQYAGALRLRLLPRSAAPVSEIAPVPPGQAAVILEIYPEPKLGGYDLLDVQVVKALDNKNQPLSHVHVPAPAPIVHEQRQVIVQNGNQLVVQQVVVPRGPRGIETAALDRGPRQVPIFLKLPEEPGDLLSRFEATVAAQVRSPLQPLIQIEDLHASLGKVVHGPGGTWLQLQLFQTLGNPATDVLIQLQLHSPHIDMLAINANLPAQLLPNQQGPPLNALRAGTASATGGGILLFDAEGTPFRTVSVQTTQMTVGPNGTTCHCRLTFRAPRAGMKPARLVYASSRVVPIELPVAFSNIPLGESR
jgi:hypothetical protein